MERFDTIIDRRGFARGLLFGVLPALLGPHRTFAGRGNGGGNGIPKLEHLTASEYRAISKMAPEIIPSDLVLSGKVDIALNLDRFMATNPSPDWVRMLRYLRLISLADPLKPLIRPFMPGIDADLLSIKRVICFMGYYSDANGEADLDPKDRLVWFIIGYPGPKSDDWWPEDEERQLNPEDFPDRYGRES